MNLIFLLASFVSPNKLKICGLEDFSIEWKKCKCPDAKKKK